MPELEGIAYEVMDEVPAEARRAKGKWRQIFDPLKMGQSVKFECDSVAEAEKLRASAANGIRQVKEVDYVLASSKKEEGGKVILYMWKVYKKGG